MNWEALAILSCAIFMFVWIPFKSKQHGNYMKSIRAINKGHRFSEKYHSIRKLAGRAA